MVYPALLPLMRTHQLPVVDWTDAPADLNGLVRFAERRNLVSAPVPSHFKRSLPTCNMSYPMLTSTFSHSPAICLSYTTFGICTCAISFQTQSTNMQHVLSYDNLHFLSLSSYLSVLHHICLHLTLCSCNLPSSLLPKWISVLTTKCYWLPS